MCSVEVFKLYNILKMQILSSFPRKKYTLIEIFFKLISFSGFKIEKSLMKVCKL